MSQFILEVPQGADVVRAIMAFARDGPHLTGTVLSATGKVERLCFEDPGYEPPHVAIHGAYRLVSLSGYFNRLPSGEYYVPSFSAVLSDQNTTIFGGVIAGSIVAFEPVTVVLYILENPSFIELDLNADNAPQENAEADVAAGDHGDAEDDADAGDHGDAEDDAGGGDHGDADDDAAAGDQGDAEDDSPPPPFPNGSYLVNGR